jgi:hypothetical protein
MAESVAGTAPLTRVMASTDSGESKKRRKRMANRGRSQALVTDQAHEPWPVRLPRPKFGEGSRIRSPPRFSL